MNDAIQKIRDFFRENKSGDPQKIISFFTFLLFGDGKPTASDDTFSTLRDNVEDKDVDAQYCLGFCYENGIGIPENKEEAAKWYREAAERGHADAQWRLGLYYGYCHNNGIAIPGGELQIGRWFSKAAEQGHPGAQYCLGACYEKAVGVEQEDEEKAINWYRKAAEQGHKEAAEALKRLSE